MKVALISTVFNEGEGILEWAKSLRMQTRQPDEFVIVDGGSTDGTPERLREAFSHGDFPAPRIIIEKCNIARGRNLAIQNTTAEIIASSDAGSFPDPNWLVEITRPLLENESVDIVGGKSVSLAQNDFQKFVAGIEGEPPEPNEGGIHGSGRNTAYRRATWADIGGYPEWLTLTGEDALFNYQLDAAGKKFSYNPAAVVDWVLRENAGAYFKMLYLYGYGAAEAQLNASYFLRRMAVLLFPPLLLLSRHRLVFFGFRYRKNFASASGWLAGWWQGRRPPPGWRKKNGILIGPETQRFLMRQLKSAG